MILVTEAQIRARTLQLDLELLDACQFEGMVGRSPLMLELFARIRRHSFQTVLKEYRGEGGTGSVAAAMGAGEVTDYLLDETGPVRVNVGWGESAA